MPREPDSGTTAAAYILKRTRANGAYSVWRFDPTSVTLLTQVHTDPSATFPASHDLCAVGGYLLDYSLAPLNQNPPVVPYRLFAFDPTSPDPLNGAAVQAGQWPKHKFWQFHDHYTWDPNETDILELVPVSGYVLVYMPTAARGTYQLWNFDPASSAPNTTDPLPNAITPQDAFSLIGNGSQLLPIGNYVLEWIAKTSQYRVWSFDPQQMRPLALPTIAEGTRSDIDATHQLLAIGDYVLDWVPATRAYRLWLFDPFQPDDPFVGPVQHGTLPEGFDGDSVLTPVLTTAPIDSARASTPGTMDFMRSKIEHVVVYMLESRTMDSVLGWLYADSSPALNYVNAKPPFRGTSSSYANWADGKRYPVTKFNDGELSDRIVLAAPAIDPFHTTPDAIHHLYSGGYPAYFAPGERPDMGGFVSNNLSGEVMVTFTPNQLPVLNGLAEAYAVCDEWFSALPGLTSSNRAFALTGSSFNVITNREGAPQYSYSHPPYTPRRQSIWKVLSNNGINDWKIYWAVKWPPESPTAEKSVFTYELFLKGEVPSVDSNADDYIAPIDQFMTDAAAGTLPKFSFLEPAWIAPHGSTSYHPGKSADLVPPEKQLKKIFDAIANSPCWDKTAFVITFSKGGGLYDHVPPPGTINPWPHDVNDGFRYDVLGPRVPTIVVSPWVNEHTVFRSQGEAPLSATSLPATILEWFGIPRSRWGLGDRAANAETFENVFQRATTRADKPRLNVPYDKNFPPTDRGNDGDE